MKKVFLFIALLQSFAGFSQKKKSSNADCINWTKIQASEKETYFVNTICKSKDLARIKTFVESGLSVNTFTPQGCPLTSIATGLNGIYAQLDESNASIRIIEELLKMGANPNFKSCSDGKGSWAFNSDDLFTYYLERYSEDNFNKVWDILIKYKGNPQPYASELLKIACDRKYFSLIDKVIDFADMSKYAYIRYLSNEYFSKKAIVGSSNKSESDFMNSVSKLIKKGANINKQGQPFDDEFNQYMRIRS